MRSYGAAAVGEARLTRRGVARRALYVFRPVQRDVPRGRSAGARASMACDAPVDWAGLPGDTVALLSRQLGARDLVS